MQALSLHKVMNEIAAHPDMVPAGPVSGVQAGGADRHFDMADIAPYLGTDPLILDLLKNYLNAKADYHAALLAHGKDSPLADIAGDHVDSAWCMLQARLFELKEDQAVAARAALLEKMEKRTFDSVQEHRARTVRREREEPPGKRTSQWRGIKGNDDRVDTLWLIILFLVLSRDPLRLFGNVFAGPPELRAFRAGN